MKRTMIPGDILDVCSNLVEKVGKNPVDGKEWGPVEALRYLIRAVTIPAADRNDSENLAVKMLADYSRSETCQAVRLKRGVKRLEMEQDGTAGILDSITGGR